MAVDEDDILVTEGLGKAFGDFKAVSDVNLRVRCGNTADIWNERTSPSRATSAGASPVMSRPL